jgi:hypothetical protein
MISLRLGYLFFFFKYLVLTDHMPLPLSFVAKVRGNGEAASRSAVLEGAMGHADVTDEAVRDTAVKIESIEKEQ